MENLEVLCTASPEMWRCEGRIPLWRHSVIFDIQTQLSHYPFVIPASYAPSKEHRGPDIAVLESNIVASGWPKKVVCRRFVFLWPNGTVWDKQNYHRLHFFWMQIELLVWGQVLRFLSGQILSVGCPAAPHCPRAETPRHMTTCHLDTTTRERGRDERLTPGVRLSPRPSPRAIPPHVASSYCRTRLCCGCQGSDRQTVSSVLALGWTWPTCPVDDTPKCWRCFVVLERIWISHALSEYFPDLECLTLGGKGVDLHVRAADPVPRGETFPVYLGNPVFGRPV